MIKINRFELENVKKIKAVTLSPSENGLTVIGGKNGQGKTSVLDAIAWALGGARFAPDEPMREGSVLPPKLRIKLSNGLVVERSGKNSALKVTDENGNKGGQQLLDEFVEELALNLPKFMNANDKEKADILLRIIGIGDELVKLELEEKELYNRRRAIGQIADQKKKHAKEMFLWEGVPKEPISASELIREQQDILAQNGENARKRENVNRIREKGERLEERIMKLRTELEQAKAEHEAVLSELEIAQMTAAELEDRSTAEIEKSLADIEAINIKVRENLDRQRAEDEALEYGRQYDDLTKKIDDVRKAKTELLNKTEMPLDGLSVDDGKLTYNGYSWDGMSGAEQLKVAAAIVRKLKPECGFVLMDKLEQMDADTLREFGAWLEENNLQAIATRVSTGGECSIIIEDGEGIAAKKEEPKTNVKWKEGRF